ncbi:MAG: transposase family protein [Gemmataceae bacterium]|nr:transposase family protein [Planctomycetia bacterium]MBX3401394.1 transposase family protein [Gemmataceae bacterium]
MAGTIASRLPDFPDFDLTAVTVATEIIGLGLRPSSASAFCPVCHQPTTRIHSRYSRTLADGSVHRRQLLLRVAARKFVCVNPLCG